MDATPQPTWPQAAPPSGPAPARPGLAHRAPAAATLVAVALVGALVGFGGSQAIDHSPSLAKTLAGVSIMLNGGAPANPAPAASTGSNPAAANPAPVRSRAPGGNRGPGGNQAPAGNQAPSGNPAPAPAGQAAASTQAGQPASTQDQAAIQQAIQAIDTAQAQAVANNDMSGLSANSTNGFASQQTSVTQDLLNNGVSQINLDNVEWGPITVNGTTATATNYETWTTTYSDSSTDQSRDRNVYTLVQQDGNWVVQADDHPDAGLPGGLQSMPGIPSNLLPPGFPNPFQNPAPGAQAGNGNSTPPVQVQP
jgi:hypothetical protein